MKWREKELSIIVSYNEFSAKERNVLEYYTVHSSLKVFQKTIFVFYGFFDNWAVLGAFSSGRVRILERVYSYGDLGCPDWNVC